MTKANIKATLIVLAEKIEKDKADAKHLRIRSERADEDGKAEFWSGCETASALDLIGIKAIITKL